VIAACVLKENEIKMVGILKSELPPHGVSTQRLRKPFVGSQIAATTKHVQHSWRQVNLYGTYTMTLMSLFDVLVNSFEYALFNLPPNIQEHCSLARSIHVVVHTTFAIRVKMLESNSVQY
jgi:hypothetical protein